MKQVCLILVAVSVLAAACASPHHAGRHSAVGTGTTLAPRPATPAHNPLFRVIREVEIPDGATGLLYADAALFTWSDVGGQATDIVTRIDLATAHITATVNQHAAGGAFAGNLLWLAEPGQLVALDPDTLAVVHRVQIPGNAANLDELGRGYVSAAGGLVWVIGAGAIFGIDPATATIVQHIAMPSPPPTDGYQFGPGDYQITLSAPPDGTALWTAETPDGGGYAALQVRNPQSGAVIESSTDSVTGIGGTQIAATDDYAWLSFATGNSGSYLKVDDRPGLAPAVTKPGIGGSNAISVSLAADDLWIYDPEILRAACADPANGTILEKASLPTHDITSLPNGEIAVVSQIGTSSASTVAIAVPKPACTQ